MAIWRMRAVCWIQMDTGGNITRRKRKAIRMPDNYGKNVDTRT